MRHSLFAFLSSLIPLFYGGCLYTGDFFKSGAGLSAQGSVAFDSRMQHVAILDLNDAQLLENLYRGYNGLPILISDYSNVHQEIVTKFTPSFSAGETITHNAYPGPTTAILASAARPYSLGMGAERDHTIDLQQDPLYTQKDPYYAIQRFLAAQNPGDYLKQRKKAMGSANATQNAIPPALPERGDIKTVMRSRTQPVDGSSIQFPDGQAKKMPDGYYYWVPTNFRADFFAMATDVVARTPSSTSTDKALSNINATVRRSSPD